LFNNPIYTSLLIVLVIMIVMYTVLSESYNEAIEEAELDDSPSFWRLMFRSGIYLLVAVFAIVFLHYKYVLDEFDKKHEEKVLKQTVQSVNVSGKGEDSLEGIFDDKPALMTSDNIVIVNKDN